MSAEVATEMAEPPTAEPPSPIEAGTGAAPKTATPTDNTENGDKNVQSMLDAKIAQMDMKKSVDKNGERELARMFKKASKELKEQLDAAPSDSDKVKFLQQKLLDKVHLCNTQERKIDALQRSEEGARRDKENVTNELNRTVAFKQKLEALCKELQQQNKNVLAQAKQTQIDEDQKRAELSAKFSETIKDVQDKIASHDEDRQKQDQENVKLREQLQSFISQYEARDKHFEHQLHAKDLECQLANAKLAQSEELCKKAIERAELYQKQVIETTEREGILREQVNSYGDKFKELQGAMTKSNEMFATFKKDSEKMQKRIKASEKDRLAAEKLAAKNAKELADLTALHDPLKKEASNLKKQKERMEMLCRTLTQERADLKEKLRSLGALPGPDLTPGMAQEDAAPPIEAAADGAAEPNPSSAGE